MNEREAIRDLLAAYALGALTPDERASAEALLRTDPAARAELSAFLQTADLLGTLAEERAPSAGLESRILEEAGADRREPTQIAPQRSARWLRRTRTWAAAAAVFAAIAVVLGVMLMQSGDHVTVRAITTGSASGTELRYREADQVTLMRVAGLAPLPGGRVYEVWTIKRGTPTGVGLFQVGGGSETRVAFASQLEAGDVVAVTSEPAGGSPAPTTQPLFTIKF